MTLSPQDLAEQFNRLFTPELSPPVTNDVAGSMPAQDLVTPTQASGGFPAGDPRTRNAETQAVRLPGVGAAAVGLIEPERVDPSPVTRIVPGPAGRPLDCDVQIPAPSSEPLPGAGLPAELAPLPGAPTSPARLVDYSTKGYHLDVVVLPGQVVAAATLLDQHGFTIDTVTGVDWIAEEQMEVVYDFFHTETAFRVVVRSRVPRGAPEMPTISEVFPGANWHERETHDFFGIRFLGHPNLTPFLLPEDADYHPLRKDFQA